MTIRSVIFSIFFLLLVSVAIYASDVTGQIEQLRNINPGNGEPGRIVVAITGATTGCTSPSRYTFANSDTGIGKVWTSFLLTAYSLGKDVTIEGDGVCRTYPGILPNTMEGVSTIELR